MIHTLLRNGKFQKRETQESCREFAVENHKFNSSLPLFTHAGLRWCRLLQLFLRSYFPVFNIQEEK